MAFFHFANNHRFNFFPIPYENIPSAPLTAALARKFGSRLVVVFGGILYGVGLVMSAVVQHVSTLAVTVVVISGE